MAINYPITVTKIEYGESNPYHQKYMRTQCGTPVSVRLVDPEHQHKTFLGFLLGEFAISPGAIFDPKTGVLTVDLFRHNPAIFVPDLNRVVFGYESWWGVIASADQLRAITDADINNTWYVKALHDIMAKAEAQAAAGEPG